MIKVNFNVWIQNLCYFLSEPFLEAVPQVFVLLALWLYDDSLIKLIVNQNYELFLASFVSSVITSTFGVAKFLRIGPCRLVSEDGLLGGYGSLGFILVFISVGSTGVSKGTLLASILIVPDSFRHSPYVQKSIVGIYITLCHLPQLLYVSSYRCFSSEYLYYLHLFEGTDRNDCICGMEKDV